MKKLKHLFLLLLALSLLFTLIACGDKGGDACKHEDEDEDGLCDLCDVCIEHLDDDEDGLCDYCDAELDGDAGEGEGIALIQDGEILFQVVLGSDIGSAKMVVDDFADIIEELGLEVSIVNDDKKTIDDELVEILVGTVTSRGEDYEYDRYSLGAEGYAITAIDETKIVITGGSDTALSDAFTKFVEDILGIDDKTDELSDVIFTEDNDEVAPQDNYRITGINIDGNDLKGYEIVRDKSVSEYNDAVDKLQNFFYSKAGYWLPIVTPENAGDKTISFVSVAKDKAGTNGFRVRVDEGNLLIECGYNNYFEKAFDEYYNNTFTGKQGEIELGDFTGEVDISVVKYSDFGAVGDGKTNDISAIRAAHTEANKGGQTVVAEKGKTYYVTPTGGNPIPVMTSVDWKGCKFIFDGSAITNETSGNIFNIVQGFGDANISIGSSNERIIALNAPAEKGEPVIKGIGHGDEQTTKLDLGLGYPAMLTVIDKDSRTYVRWGYVDSKGGEQKEVIIVDKDGNIDPSTPFLLDYEKVTSITVHKIDVEPITIENATITSLASRINLGIGGYHSYNMGITVARPNVTVKNLTHLVEGEMMKYTPVRVDANGLSYDVTDEGYTYSGGAIYKSGKQYTEGDVTPFVGPSWGGILSVRNTHNAKIENCTFTARVHYVEGTYDIGANTSNKIVFENCKQTNFFDEREQFTRYNGGVSTFPNLSVCWGVMGSNYTKNMDYINCELTRYDAHAGVFNGKVIGGKLAVLRLIGGGTFIIEGVEIYRSWRTTCPFQLREDYGSTFFGTVTIKDVTIKDGQYSQDGKFDTFPALFDAPVAPWDNGYVNHFPNLIIDNISVETTSTEIPIVSITSQKYDKSGEHYPANSLVKDDVSNPNALITTYFETKNPNIVEEDKERFYYLEGFKKVNKDPSKLSNGEYTVVDNGNGTYTVIAKGVKNINPYQPPEFIEIKNMKGKKNSNGKDMYLTLYDCNFFKNTKIIDEDRVLKKVKVPK